eukprot:1158641-Pelagomonas_calceolata.AAC.5
MHQQGNFIHSHALIHIQLGVGEVAEKAAAQVIGHQALGTSLVFGQDVCHEPNQALNLQRRLCVSAGAAGPPAASGTGVQQDGEIPRFYSGSRNKFLVYNLDEQMKHT